MDLKYVKSLLKLFDESTATEISIEEDGAKIKLSKKIEKQRSEQQFVVPQQIPMNYSNPVQSAPITSNTNTSENNTANSDNSNLHEINSPMVGTFYKSPSPDAEAFVKVGDRVEPGTTLCIIEAMKVMNEIECDVSGTIEKILIENASPVEFNQVLFLIKAD
jgi:acetyl-CoA carboxylase biotin carboxyl carrier protein